MPDTDTKIDEILDTLLKVECQEFHKDEKPYQFTTENRENFDKGIAEAKAAFTALIREAQKETLDKVYELAPQKKFELWKPMDGFNFIQRLKEYEAALEPGNGGKVDLPKMKKLAKKLRDYDEESEEGK